MSKTDNLKQILNSTETDETKLVESAGQLIDLASENSDKASTEFAIGTLELNEYRISILQNKCLFHYHLSVAYSDLHKFDSAKTEKDWEWEQELITNEIKNLRLASSFITKETDEILHSNILTNLANRLSNLGRFVISLDFWNKAYKIDNNTGMPLINKGDALMHYGLNYLSQPKYQAAYIQLAHQLLKLGLQKDIYEQYKNEVSAKVEAIEKNYSQYLEYKFLREDFEENTDEKDYLDWCIKHKLCLNPLSNLDIRLASGKDDILLHANTETEFVELFENIKNDFVFARHQFYQSFNSKYSKQLKKSSFSGAYSIFDRLAYLINGIFQLTQRYDRVAFNRIWYKNLDKNKGLLDTLTESKNLMLRALYWVSKDIYTDEDGFKNLIEPKAKEICKIRNFIEHKSFDFGIRTEDDFTFHITEQEFDECLFSVLELVRECIIYLSCATQIKSNLG